jgi:hypothetical protein
MPNKRQKPDVRVEVKIMHINEKEFEDDWELS